MTAPEGPTGRIVISLTRPLAEQLSAQARASGDVTNLADATAALSALEPLKQLVESYLPDPTRVTVRKGSTLKQLALEEQLLGPARKTRGLAGFFTIDARGLSPERTKALVAALRQVPGVRSAYEQRRSRSAKEGASHAVIPESPLGHLDALPRGIGVHSAKKGWVPFNGKGIGFADIESIGVGWNLDHEFLSDIDKAGLTCPVNAFPEGGVHGTQTLGVIFSARNHAVRGIAPRSLLKALLTTADDDEPGEEDIAGAIQKASLSLDAGDVMLLELETTDHLPVEVFDEVFYAIEAAVEKGIIVIEPAGNGYWANGHATGWNLDEVARDPELAPAWNPADEPGAHPETDAIIVSGCEADTRKLPPWAHRKATGLNFGSRVDCFAWGEYVQSTGDDMVGESNVNRRYANTFDGTSAAAAIIAGLALLLQEHAAQSGARLTPAEMRQLLRNKKHGTLVSEKPEGVLPAFTRIAKPRRGTRS